MAKVTGLSPAAIGRIWRAFGLQPHRTDTFKLSTDPFFVEKVRDVVGLYLSPPERAIVLCLDEKPKCKRWIVPNRFCRWGPGKWSVARMITNATVSPRCLRPSTWRPVK